MKHLFFKVLGAMREILRNDCIWPDIFQRDYIWQVEL